MRDRLIPRAEWFRFFTEFSRRYEGWLVTVRVLHPNLGAQVEARDLGLEGIVTTPAGEGPISLHLGSSAASNVEHEISRPRKVRVEVSDRGVEEALGILSEDGTKTVVEFRSPALPETVDGILHP